MLQAIQKFSSTCWFGGGDIGGLSLRHVIFATGLKAANVESYDKLFAHSIPAPLDLNVLGFYRLEDEQEIRQNF